MDNCLFCKIIEGTIPCFKIWEDDLALAFLDIKPVNNGHVLVIPKKHSADLFETDPAILQHIITLIPKLAKAVLNSLDYNSFNLGVNNGAEAGQLVPHLHFHIMPRRAGDGHELFHGKGVPMEELASIAEKIKSSL